MAIVKRLYCVPFRKVFDFVDFMNKALAVREDTPPDWVAGICDHLRSDASRNGFRCVGGYTR
jgi:hypothetical protein